MGTFNTLFLALACSNSPVDSTHASVRDDTGGSLVVELPFSERALLTELVDSCSSAVSIDAHRYLCATPQGVHYRDEVSTEAIPLGAYSSIAAAAVGEQTLISLDGAVGWFDGAELTPLDWLAPVPIETMDRVGETVWMTGVGRLFRIQGGVVSEIAVDDSPTIYAHAVTDDRLYLSVPELVSLDLGSAALETRTVWNQAVQSIAADANGAIWFVADEQLFVRRGEEEPVEVWMPEPVEAVVGPTIWVQGETELYRYENGAFTVHPIVAAGMVGVDSVGRLLQVREGTLRRHSVGRPVVAVGLSDSVMVAETVTLLPSDPDSVEELRVWIGAKELAVSTEPYRVTVDPELLAVGEHQLRFFTQSEKGDSLTSESVWVGELDDVQWGEIEALSEQHCARCHGGETLTDLSTASDWEHHIDAIIDVVMMQEMPLGGPYLTESEIVSIRAWKHGGFQ